MAVSWLRLMTLMLKNPGRVPRGPAYYQHRSKGSKPTRSRSRKEGEQSNHLHEKDDEYYSGSRNNGTDGVTSLAYNTTVLENGIRSNATNIDPQLTAPGLEDFYMRDVFVCESDGKP